VIGDQSALRRFYAAFNAQDLPALLTTVHPGVILMPVLGPLFQEHVYRGRAGITRWYGELHERWEAFEIHVDELHEIDGGVVAFLTLVGHRDGRALEARIAAECRFKGGRIHRIRGRDLHETAAEIGVSLAAA
jgi:ketosteroid isomerase-like protein